MVNNEFKDEKILFRRIAADDEAAFASLFQTFYQPLFWHAFKLLKAEFWAEEMVQEIFAQLWLNRKSLDAIEHPSSYLFKMVANKALDRIRRQELEIKLQYFISTQFQTAEQPGENDQWDQIDTWLMEAISALPEQRKRVYELKYQEGFSYEEIASQLSISKNTVRNQMVKALQSIRTYLLEKKLFWLLFLLFLVIF